MTIKQLKVAVIFMLISVFIMACGAKNKSTADKPFGDCQYGAPKAVFNAQIPKVTTHTFQLNSKSAIEKVQFDGGISLELIQSGCEKPKQEFQFTIPSNTQAFTDRDWLSMGIDLFAYMGNLAPELQPFLLWQGALKEQMNQLKIGLPYELEQGFFVKIDKVTGSESGLLLMTLYQE